MKLRKEREDMKKVENDCAFCRFRSEALGLDLPPLPEKQVDYVVGFLCDRERQLVVLIEKQKPDWQRGKLNGVGGHIEKGELPVHAMEREFEEETGLFLTGWEHSITLTGPEARVFFFWANWKEGGVRTITNEKIIIANYYRLPLNTLLSIGIVLSVQYH